MAQAVKQDSTRYNVACTACDSVFEPAVRSPLWWRAKQREEKGFLDALRVNSHECGCVTKPKDATGKFRVFGYDDMCTDFDAVFDKFTDAVRTFLRLDRQGCNVVFISGVSPAVESKLRFG